MSRRFFFIDFFPNISYCAIFTRSFLSFSESILFSHGKVQNQNRNMSMIQLTVKKGRRDLISSELVGWLECLKRVNVPMLELGAESWGVNKSKRQKKKSNHHEINFSFSSLFCLTPNHHSLAPLLLLFLSPNIGKHQKKEKNLIKKVWNNFFSRYLIAEVCLIPGGIHSTLQQTIFCSFLFFPSLSLFFIFSVDRWATHTASLRPSEIYRKGWFIQFSAICRCCCFVADIKQKNIRPPTRQIHHPLSCLSLFRSHEIKSYRIALPKRIYIIRYRVWRGNKTKKNWKTRRNNTSETALCW